VISELLSIAHHFPTLVKAHVCVTQKSPHVFRHVTLVHFKQSAVVQLEPLLEIFTVSYLRDVVAALLADAIGHTVKKAPLRIPTIAAPGKEKDNFQACPWDGEVDLINILYPIL